jgi:hypothetical protein
MSIQALRLLTFAAAIAILGSCSGDVGPGVAVRLRGVSVDGKPFPASLPIPGNKVATIAEAYLVGTNWGAACGIVLRLTSGATTAGEIPDCKLKPGESRTVTVTLPDERFPSGSHEYHFVPYPGANFPVL